MALWEQEDGDASIAWETPETPVNADNYIFMHGKRMVRPYYFEYLAHVKKRWAGKFIVDVFAQEFKGRPPEYYVQAVESGRIRVDGRRVASSYVVRDSQKMSHFVHRHEPPVMAVSVKILQEGPNVITVCKPPSIPVHPCGQYRKNTVMGILEAEHNTGQLFREILDMRDLYSAIHRLDRLVSGLLILARNAETANLFREEIVAGRVYKQYVAKVKGVFPAHEVEVNAAVVYDPREGISSVEAGQSGVNKSKAACTKFQRISTNGVYSIVRCEPVTGRTHQIRVHLQHLGHPIANDNLYLQAHPPKRSREGSSADTAAKAARTVESCACSVSCLESSSNATTSVGDVEKLGSVLRTSETEKAMVDIAKGGPCYRNCGKPVEAIVHRHSIKNVSLDASKSDLNADGCFQAGSLSDSSADTSIQRIVTSLHSPLVNLHLEKDSYQMQDKGQPFSVDMLCTHCPNLGPSGYKTNEDGLWLHCVQYASPSWAYNCPLPDWAL